ncbi:PREDICTED: thionin-like isoform X2 [Camelina sativa]|uniref:Thionin-like isoform X2 n=1 Tax=Camelina sativa TaxID=90675 RepID=A0ABM0Z697_CAMSA|nr:PREDICTED: thionin-like isoform X2 [Camelina sativa]
MEGKTLILSVLVMSLVMAQIQVEAKSCCPNTTARNCYNVCRLTGASRETCAKLCGCKIVEGPCPPGPRDILENSVSEYCKLGCASSVCRTLATLDNSDASEIVNGAVVPCTEACSELCTKGSSNVV